MSETLTIDGMTFEVRRSARRKTIELIVDRGGELRIAAPMNTEAGAMADYIRDKRFWIYTKLAEKEALRAPGAVKEFVTGEGFLYLGRSYRLLLVDAQDRPLKLEAGRFRLVRAEAEQGREHFVRWYIGHAQPWLRQRARLWWARLRLKPTEVVVRDLGFRWGSCGKSGTLNFHWATILLPASMVEYVLVHEMVHLHERNHTPEFWRRLERAMPDYPERKAWLAEHGGRVLEL